MFLRLMWQCMKNWAWAVFDFWVHSMLSPKYRDISGCFVRLFAHLTFIARPVVILYSASDALK